MSTQLRPRRSSRSAVGTAILVGGLTLLTGLTQCEETCVDYDEDGNRIEFACVTCVERDAEPCTVDSWRLPPGSSCDLSQQPDEDDGTPCDLSGAPAVCMNGVCELVPVLAAGSGSTTWRATTNPPGGDPAAQEGGCYTFTTAGPNIRLDVTITLNVSSDGAGNVTLGYDLTLASFLVPSFQDAGELSDIALTTEFANATPSEVANTITSTAVGQPISAFVVPPGIGHEIVLATPGEITEQIIQVTPTSSGTVNINWSGDFYFRVTLGPYGLLFHIDQSVCTFDVQGTGIDFQVVQP